MDIFQYKILNLKKLAEYGFDGNCYKTPLSDLQMVLTISVAADGSVDTAVTDMATGEEYTLYKVEGAVGAFVGQVREQVNAVLQEIADRCFDREVFHSAEAKQIINYVQQRYGDQLEFLWPKFPDNAIVRRQDNRKWYLALLTVARSKLGLAGEEKVEIIDLRVSPEQREQLAGEGWVLPGYHMNKKSWITIVLNGTVPFARIQALIDQSYYLAKGK